MNRSYRKTVITKGGGRRTYDVIIEDRNYSPGRELLERSRREGEARRRARARRKPPTDAEWEAFGMMMMALAMPFIALWALFQWLIHANRKPASFDRQLWLSRSGESWVGMWEHARRGKSRYDLYVYSPGDWVWNLVGSYTEWPNAATAKDEWVRYVEQGGTYQLWLDSQRSAS